MRTFNTAHREPVAMQAAPQQTVQEGLGMCLRCGGDVMPEYVGKVRLLSCIQCGGEW